jgi:hypothetical protein
MKNLNFKQMLSYVPEMVLLLVAVVWFSGDLIAVSSVNYFALAFVLIIFALLIWKNRIIGLTLATLLGLTGIYMFLALFSEYHEFPAGDPNGVKMVLIGSLIFASMLVISVLLYWKYLRKVIG